MKASRARHVGTKKKLRRWKREASRARRAGKQVSAFINCCVPSNQGEAQIEERGRRVKQAREAEKRGRQRRQRRLEREAGRKQDSG
jgi:hypothetical protein